MISFPVSIALITASLALWTDSSSVPALAHLDLNFFE